MRPIARGPDRRAFVLRHARLRPVPGLPRDPPGFTAAAAPAPVENTIRVEGVRDVESLLNNLPQVFADQGGQVSNGATGTATSSAIAAAASTAATTCVASAFTSFAFVVFFVCRFFAVAGRCLGFFTSKQAFDPREETFFSGRFFLVVCFWSATLGWGRRFGVGNWRWQIWQDAFDDGRLLIGGLLGATGHRGGVFKLLRHFVAGFDAV